jgi:hypothetical protein
VVFIVNLNQSKIMLLRYGPPIVQCLFNSLSGQVPAYAVDEDHGSIGDVLWNLNRLSHDALRVNTMLRQF